MRAIAKEMLTTAEAASELGMHPNTLKRIAPVALPYFRINGRGDRRYRRTDLAVFLAARLVTA